MDGSHTRRGQPCWFRDPKVRVAYIHQSVFKVQAEWSFLKKKSSTGICIDMSCRHVEILHSTRHVLLDYPDDWINLYHMSL